jgi:hypothetical protein
LAELQKAYVASQYLDAKVTFVTERQAREDRLGRYKLLLVPGARNLPPDVVERIREYAAGGGRVLILPESLLGDEYNRRADYLARLGITVKETRRPKAGGGGRMVQGYDQSFSEDVSLDAGAPLKLAPGPRMSSVGALETGGVRQVIQVAGQPEVLYRQPDGSPAIVRILLGRGAIDYAACSLEQQGYARLLDALFDEAGLARPVRVVPNRIVEARFARLGDRRLLYVANLSARPVRLKVGTGSINVLEELRDQRSIRGSEIELPGRQTGIYEIQ